jgi:hypothetical protein
MALEACCGPAAALLHGGPADPAALGEDAYALPCGSARDVGLDQGAPVVSRGPLPAHAAALGDEPQMPVTPHRRGSGRVARHRARARRDDDVVIEAAHSYVLCGWLPHCKCDLTSWRVGRVQSSVRPVGAAVEGLLALMGSANRVRFCLSGHDASDKTRVVPVPGLTGFAITSRRSPQPPEAEFRGLPPPMLPASARGTSGRSHRGS